MMRRKWKAILPAMLFLLIVSVSCQKRGGEALSEEIPENAGMKLTNVYRQEEIPLPDGWMISDGFTPEINGETGETSFLVTRNAGKSNSVTLYDAAILTLGADGEVSEITELPHPDGSTVSLAIVYDGGYLYAVRGTDPDTLAFYSYLTRYDPETGEEATDSGNPRYAGREDPVPECGC